MPRECHHLFISKWVKGVIDRTLGYFLCSSFSLKDRHEDIWTCLRLPEDALEHGECSPEIRTADLHCEDTGAHNPVADADQDPETRNMISVWS